MKRALTIVLSTVGITFCVAIGLILSDPIKPLPPTDSLDFEAALRQNLDGLPPTEPVRMRDGHDLPVRTYGPVDGAKPLVLLVHGSGWHGMQFHGLARGLAKHARVLVPDLRGHGVNPVRRGDVDYIGQFEDDLSDVIVANVQAGQKVVMLGHSSGGGLVVRFAGGTHGDLIDHAILMAPFLKYNAPTTRENSGGWATVRMRRLIGQVMLNTTGITALNHLKMIQFNMPAAVTDGPLGDTATLAYSYRLNTGFAPRNDYLKDIAALPKFTLIVGSGDEAFKAEEYEPLMSAVTGQGRYVVVPQVGHLEIVDAAETLNVIQEDLSGL